jgi:hypothetical protein
MGARVKEGTAAAVPFLVELTGRLLEVGMLK